MKIKNEAELLSTFCDKNEFRQLLRAPFLNTRYNEVWSTNGHVLIRISPKILVGEYTKGELNLPPLECPCRKKVTIEAIEEALKKCPQVDEEAVVQEAIECDECNGEGEVYWEYRADNGRTYSCLHDCPICDGTGQKRPEMVRKTGRHVVDDEAIIKVGNAYIFVKYIRTLKSAMEHLNVMSVEMLFNPAEKMNEFAIGDIRIGLSTILYDEARHECSARLKLIDL
jgi:hypothetical protein